MGPEKWIYTLPLRLRSLFRREHVERELDEELRCHLEQEIQGNLAKGLAPELARLAAIRGMRGIDQLKEESRDTRRVNVFEDTVHDLRFGLRMLRKNPMFTLIAVLTLALGIGATTVIFSVVNQVLLHPLPYAKPESLVLVLERIPMIGGLITMPPVDVQEIQKKNRVFESSAAYESVDMEIRGESGVERVPGVRASANLFPLLGVSPVIGRTFTESEDTLAQPVAVLSFELWQRGFGGTPDILGKTIHVDRKPYLVIGVMPRGFVFPPPVGGQSETPQLWRPMSYTQEELAGRDWYNFDLIARLKPGITLSQATTDVSTISDSMYSWMAKKRANLQVSASVLPLHDRVVRNSRTLLLLLLGAIFTVLLIGCANIASLQLSRSAERRREIAVRVALGATRKRLVRLLFVENLTLSLGGGSFGLIFALWGTRAFVALLPGTVPHIGEIHADASVIAFTAILSAFTGVFFGVIPALAMIRVNVNDTLKETGRRVSASGFWKAARGVIVIAQIATALVLLMAGSLLVRSFVLLQETEPGFQTQNVLTMSVDLPKAAYVSGTQIVSFYNRLIERVSALPGVREDAAGTDIPMHESWQRIFEAEGHPLALTSNLRLIHSTAVLGSYFKTLGIPLKAGRFFGAQDGAASPPVAIISEGMARTYWPGENPVGQRMRFSATLSWMTIAGVVGDVKDEVLEEMASPHVYFPYLQFGEDGFTSSIGRSLTLIVKTTSAPESEISGVRSQVQAIDPQQPVANVRTMDEIIRRSTLSRRFNTLMFAGFGCVALFLALAGLYGVVSHAVRQRTPEIGIRIALGAHHADVLWIVLRQGLALVIAGVGLGLAGAFAIAHLVETLLYAVKPNDPGTVIVVSVGMIAVATLACVIPAFRAMRVDPAITLRYE
jgi:predicted permease